MTIVELGPNLDKDWRNDLNNNFREVSGIQGSVNDAVNKANTADQKAQEAKFTADLNHINTIDSQQKIKGSVLFDTPQVNIFNSNTVTMGYFLINGNPTVSPGNCYSDYISVTPNNTMWFTRLLTSDAGSLYDINKNLISKFIGNGTNLYTIPANVYYIRINISLSVSPLNSFMVVKDSAAPSRYYDYRVGKISGLKINSDHIDGGILPEQLAESDILNLFDVTTSLSGKGVDNSGNIVDSAGLYLNRYVKVTPGETIGCTHNFSTPGCYYTNEYNFLKKIDFTETGAGSGWFTSTVPDGASFVRVNVTTSALSSYMLKKSIIKPESYSPYRVNPKWLQSSADTLKGSINPEQLADVEVLNLYDIETSYKSKYRSNTGVVADSTIIDLSRFIIVSPGEILGCNFNYTQPGAYLDSEQRWIKKIDFTETSTGSGWYTSTVPNNARFVQVNVVKNDLPTYMLKKSAEKPKGYSPYSTKIPWAVLSTSKLFGKLIATFGDSITWLDGKVIAEAGSEPVKGYQYYMRKAGAIVDNFGHSGATIARSGIGGVGCILDDIKAQDVTKYEIITIAGGTNDIGQNVNFGVVGVEEDTTFDETTTFGALRAAIEYIRSKNPKCRIYISTPIRSGRATRPSAKMQEVSEGLRNIAKMYSCPLVDMHAESGIGKGTYSTHLYDDLHPNNDGFRAMGDYIVGQLTAK
ncbi:SGNH/GDSL hydrolase family protein [Bacillus wiedmannii]|uniref:SGNH/GDSL hydrolase family protein n=1 Tax=Bacillus wiedmannii TaxID=1890302 RepID=UPI000BF9A1AB|nr:SGNH/GDSL hydrolase family protein [Bacillus wiedmannii]PFY95239.1 hypothetical protein COL57_22640 [Bacillus wiedmannii]